MARLAHPTAAVRNVALAALVAAVALFAIPAPGTHALGSDVSWTLSAVPSQPSAGDTVRLTATAYGSGGIPRFTLHLDERNPPVLRADSPLSVDRQTLSATVDWDLTALRAGQQTLHVSVNYEKQSCPGPPPDCFFQFVFSSSPTFTIDVPASAGDVNCDGEPTSIDAALVLQQAARLLETLPCPAAGDANGDGLVDATDAALILQFVAGLISQFP